MLNELIGVYKNPDKIDFDILPQKFVLKCTHGSKFNVFCEDKDTFDREAALHKLRKWMNTNYFWWGREWVYKKIKPMIMCEKLMTDRDGKAPLDYKFHCFHGEPKIIQLDIDLLSNFRQNFYDTEWNFRNIEKTVPNDKNINIPKPGNFDEMLSICRKLSQPFPYARVDLYNLDGSILFGELTFFPSSGYSKFRDEELEIEMGQYLDLGTINKKGRYSKSLS